MSQDSEETSKYIPKLDPNFSLERNFHIFYYLYDGLASQNLLEAYYLEPCPKKRSHR